MNTPVSGRKYKKYSLVWLEIPISIGYCDGWSIHPSLPNGRVNHLEIHAACPLPVTDTGYRSHFTYECIDNPVEYVRKWLELEKIGKRQWEMYERSVKGV